MPDTLRIPYSSVNDTGEAGLLPYLPILLDNHGAVTTAAGLVDTGATVNVLPYSIGLELGAVWDDQSSMIELSGNLASFPAQPLMLSVIVGQFSPVRLAFAWTHTDNVPLLLGQINFLMEFDVCFFRSRRVFDIQPKS